MSHLTNDPLVENADGCECWICGEENVLLEIIHPCSCIGSVGAVHRTCLTNWVRNSGKTHCMQCNDAYVMAIDETRSGSWSSRAMAAKCAALFAAESVVFLAIAHVPIVVVTPIAYVAWTSAADNVQTRLASALLTAYGGELLVMLVVALIYAFVSCFAAHERACGCCHCRCGNRSLITDLYILSIFSSSNSRSSSTGSSDCNCSGGNGGHSGSSSGSCDGESVAGIPVAIAIMLVLCVALFYFICLGVVLYIAYRHVSKYYARRKMDVFVIQSIR